MVSLKNMTQQQIDIILISLSHRHTRCKIEQQLNIQIITAYELVAKASHLCSMKYNTN